MTDAARPTETVQESRGSARRGLWLLAGVAALLILRVATEDNASHRCGDETQIGAVATRLVTDGGPLYGNALTNYTPGVYWFVAAVFRVCGPHNLAAVRLAELAWWLATAAMLYAAARTTMSRSGALAAGGAFLLATLMPAFRQVRGEPLVSLPIAAAVALAASGLARRQWWRLLLAGAATAVAFLLKQQAGMALPAVAAFPLLAWVWQRRERSLWHAIAGSALVAAGFAATVGAVWLYFVARGAGHAAFYCTWSYNLALLQQYNLQVRAHAATSGGLVPTATFLWSRLVRYAANEPLLPLALAGVVAGFALPRGGDASEGRSAWRGWMSQLAVLLGALWFAASHTPTTEPSRHAYIHYQSQLYVPMCLLVGVCVELLSRLASRRRALAAVAAALLVGYVLVPAMRPGDSVAFRLAICLRSIGGLQMAGALLAFAVAGALLGGRRAAWVAPLAWALVYVSTPGLLGWEGTHLAWAVCLVGVGVLWQASERGSAVLAGVAGLVHAAALPLLWAPECGLALGAAAWLLCSGRAPRWQRLAMAAVYALPPLAFSYHVGMVMSPAGVGPLFALTFGYWQQGLLGWLLPCRLAATASVAGLLLCARGAGGWRRAARGPLALVLCAALGAIAAGVCVRLEPYSLAVAGSAATLAAALAVVGLTRSGTPASSRAFALLKSACLVAATVALTRGVRPAPPLLPMLAHAQFVRAMEPGSRVYVRGRLANMELYYISRALPAAPQIGTWMVEKLGPPALGTGLHDYPAVATLADLDRHLAGAPPRYVVAMRDVSFLAPPGAPRVTVADLPRFGPILRARYRSTITLPAGTLYERVAATP
ncbi:glycosyltransferase family 39 protein [bacterium]|nr:glycosyltransferase family 39 protein [bacterium]